MTRYDVLQRPRATHRGTPAILIFRMTDSAGVRTDDGGVLIVIAVYARMQIAYVHTGSMQVVFHSIHLTFEECSRSWLVGAFVFAFAEVEKAIIRRFSGIAAYRASFGQRSLSFALVKEKPET